MTVCQATGRKARAIFDAGKAAGKGRREIVNEIASMLRANMPVSRRFYWWVRGVLGLKSYYSPGFNAWTYYYLLQVEYDRAYHQGATA